MSNKPIRADHVGSLLRTPALKQARERAARGEITREQLRAAEDQAITHVVKLQESVGLESITDGEQRRDWWHIDFLCGFDGVTTTSGSFGVDFHGTTKDEQPPLMSVVAPIRRSKPNMLDHFTYLKSVTRKTPKFSMPAPGMLHARGDRATLQKTYPDLDLFWTDLTAAYRAEMQAMVDAGCRYFQIDDTTVAMMGDPKVRDQFKSNGDDPDKTIAMYTEATNMAIKGLPTDATVATAFSWSAWSFFAFRFIAGAGIGGELSPELLGGVAGRIPSASNRPRRRRARSQDSGCSGLYRNAKRGGRDPCQVRRSRVLGGSIPIGAQRRHAVAAGSVARI